MPIFTTDFVRIIASEIDSVKNSSRFQTLNLGGVSGASGGGGGPLGGFIGQLPQKRVAYDTSEEAKLTIASGSGSLLDNLNHIRYKSKVQITTSEPTVTFPGQAWVNTTSGPPYALNVRNTSDNAWLLVSSQENKPSISDYWIWSTGLIPWVSPYSEKTASYDIISQDQGLWDGYTQANYPNITSVAAGDWKLYIDIESFGQDGYLTAEFQRVDSTLAFQETICTTDQGNVSANVRTSLILTGTGSNLIFSSTDRIRVITTFHTNSGLPHSIEVYYEGTTDSRITTPITDKLVSSILFTIDGGGSNITGGVKGDIVVDFNCEILSTTLLADQSGAITVDIWKTGYDLYPPTNTDSITMSGIILPSGIKSQDNILQNWTTAISAGDILRYNVDSASSVERVLVDLKVIRT